MPEPAVPGDHPDDRRLHRGDPALRDRPAVVVPRDPVHHHRRTSGSRRAPTTTTSTCSCRPATCCWSFVKVLVFAVVIILIHCYYGYTASGGPAGVGVAVGRPCARRSSRSTSSTSSCPWPSGAPPRPCGSRGSADAHGCATPPPSVPGSARTHAYGLVFLLVLALLLGLSVAMYQQAVHPGRPVDAEDRPASATSCRPRSDVKIRGLIVGEVRAVEHDGRRRRGSSWRCSPDQVGAIPANVTRPAAAQDPVRRAVRRPGPARRRPSRRRCAAGDVIGRTARRVAIELEQVLDDLLPLLRTVQPAQLVDHAQRDGHRPGGPRRAARREPRALDDLPHGAQPAPADPRRRTSAGSPTSPTIYADAAPDLLHDRCATSRSTSRHPGRASRTRSAGVPAPAPPASPTPRPPC